MKQLHARVKLLSKSHPFVISVLLTGLLFSTNALLLHPFWESNDDPNMAMICSGKGFAAVPDEHIPFSHFSLGILLKALYSGFPGVAWYSINLLSAQFVAWCVICHAFLSKSPSISRLTLFLVLFCVCGVHMLNSLQFTTTAFLCGLAGYAVLVVWSESWHKPTVLNIAAASILILWTCLIRQSSIHLLLVLSLLWLTARLTGGRKTQKLVWSAVILALTLVCSSILQWANEQYYAGNAWSYFYPMNAALSTFTDYRAPQTLNATATAVLSKLHWTDNDLEMLRLFFVIDPNVFDSDKLISLSAVWPGHELSIGSSMECLRTIFTSEIVIPAVLTTFFLGLFTETIRFGRKSVILLYIEAIALFVCMQARIPPRLYFPVFSFLAMTVFLYVDDTNLVHFWHHLVKERWGKIGVASLVFVLLCGYVSYLESTLNREWLRRESVRLELVRSIRRFRPNPYTLYFAWSTCFPYETLPPYDDLGTYFSSFKLAPINWQGPSPLLAARLKEFSIKPSEICQSLYANKAVRVISRPDLFNSCLANYIWQHYHLRVKFIQSFGSSAIAVYEIKIAEPPMDKVH